MVSQNRLYSSSEEVLALQVFSEVIEMDGKEVNAALTALLCKLNARFCFLFSSRVSLRRIWLKLYSKCFQVWKVNPMWKFFLMANRGRQLRQKEVQFYRSVRENILQHSCSVTSLNTLLMCFLSQTWSLIIRGSMMFILLVMVPFNVHKKQINYFQIRSVQHALVSLWVLWRLSSKHESLHVVFECSTSLYIF